MLFFMSLDAALQDPASLSPLRRLYAAGAGLAAVVVALCLATWRAAPPVVIFRRLTVAAPLIATGVVIGFVVMFGPKDPTFTWLVREDGPVEWMTAVIDFAAAAAFITAAWLTPRSWTIARLFFVACAAATLFIAASEISFGQRIFDIETPESFAAINRQQEITLHNIVGVDRFVYWFLPFVLLAAALASLWAGPLVRRALDLLGAKHVPQAALLPDWRYGVFFAPMAGFSVYALGFSPNHVFKMQEPAEFLIGVGLLAIAIDRTLWMARRKG